MQRAAHVAVGSFQVDMMNEEPATPLWQIILPILFIIGMMATLVHTLSSLFRIIRIIRHSEQYPQTDGTTICVTGNASLTPFSWMHYIVMNRSDYETYDAAILAHERGHIRLHHSWDLLFVDTLTALQWFNPAMWMLRSDLRAIHEYEADAAVLSQGINARQYQYLLITKAAGIGGYSLANGISHSTLKNRINMMLHTKSDRSRLLKLLALLPIVGIALAVNAEKVVDVRYDEPQKQNTKKKVKGVAEKKADTSETNTAVGTFEPVQGDVFDVVEEMPQYPGGPQALFKFLGENVQYPAEAEKAGIQGRVIATFVVEKDGSISQPTIVKSVDPLLDAEAIRVISAMPNWIPGKQNGKVVRVKYTVPLSFNLDGGGEEVDRLCREDGTIVEIDIEKGDTTIAKPLFIVDGKVMDGRKVYAINPKTIERYYMQNGQEAIDKYGDKAKDGVILITLKKD
jgi:TonB family protein